MDKIFTEQLRNQSEGHALYHKTSEAIMKPGSCGYFSEAGLWKPILNVTDLSPNELQSQGWQPLTKQLEIESDRGIRWPMKVSDSVSRISIGGEVKASSPVMATAHQRTRGRIRRRARHNLAATRSLPVSDRLGDPRPWAVLPD